MANDRKVALNGGLWTSVSTAVTISSSLARVMILTRFLEKNDFGIVSIVNMVIGLCTTFTDLGFASSIMSKPNISNNEFSSLYWTQFLLFTIIYFIIWGCSPVIANFYEAPLLAKLIPLAALSIIFQAIGSLYDSILQKRYLFRLLAIRNIVSNILSLIIAIVLAINGFGVYSLVVSSLFQALLLGLWNFISGNHFLRIRFFVSLRSVHQLIKVGLFQTGTRICDFFSNKIDVMIIGKLLGTEVLGVYDLSKELVYRLVDFIRSVVSRVALPIFSNHSSDELSVKRKFLVVTKIIAFICLPICVGIAVFSEDILHIIYGETYISAAPLVSIFAVITAITSFTSFFDMLGIIKGRTDLNFYNTIVRICVTTPIIFICSHVSITTVAFGHLVATCILAVVFWRIVVRRTYPIPFLEYFSQFKRLLVVIVSIGAILYFVMSGNFIGFNNTLWIWRFVGYGITFVLLLLASCMLFLKEDIYFLWSLIKSSNHE